MYKHEIVFGFSSDERYAQEGNNTHLYTHQPRAKIRQPNSTVVVAMDPSSVRYNQPQCSLAPLGKAL